MINYLVKLLARDNFLTVNKELARRIGLNESIMLSELCNIAGYKNVVDDCEKFSATIDEIENATTLTRKQQDRAVKNLEMYGIIEKSVEGIPAKRYFCIKSKKIKEIIENSPTYLKREAQRLLDSL